MKTLGFFEEYFVNSKYIGTKNCEFQNNRIIGWSGKIKKVADTVIILDNGKKIKPGVNYNTRYYPLNGKAIF